MDDRLVYKIFFLNINTLKSGEMMPEERHGNFPMWLKPEYVDVFRKNGYTDYNSLIKALEAHGSIYVMSQIGGRIPQDVINNLVESEALERRRVIREPDQIQI